MFKLKYLPWLVMAGFVASLSVAVPVFAAGAGRWGGGMHSGPMMQPGVFGTVSTISGDTLTVTEKQRPNATTTPTVYTVDATNAKVMKNGTSSTVSAIATGDTVMVQGTVSGTNVTATVIRDGVGGMMGRGGPGFMAKGFGHGSTSTPAISPIKGNGEPVVGGSVTAITGNVLTVTNASNVTYSVDVTSSTIVKNGATTTIASIATGDNVVVQGVVNGASVTASSVIDQGGSPSGTGIPSTGSHPGIFLTIGNFFKHIFGF